MNILAYFNLIKRKVDRFNRAVETQRNHQYSSNPFTNAYNKTYVWIDDNDDNEFLR